MFLDYQIFGISNVFSLNRPVDRKPGGSSEFQRMISDGRESNV